MSTGRDFSAKDVLQKYDSERYARNLTMMAGVDAINTVFTETHSLYSGLRGISDNAGTNAGNGPVRKGARLLRSAGMLGLNSVKPLKKEIAKFAMGLK